MPAPSRPTAPVALTLLAAAPLLMAQECVPVAPEQDQVLAGHAEAIARLEAEHASAITLLRDYHERSDENVSRFRIRDDGQAHDELVALQASLPRLERIVAVEYTQDGSPADPFCGEGGEITRFEIDLITRGAFGKPIPTVAIFELCRADSDGPDQLWYDVGELELRNPEWVARVLRRSEAEAMRLIEVYEADRQMERIAILGALLGCPTGTQYRHGETSHFCVSGELMHGPYIEGELTETLVGQRMLEGAYHNGQKHGLWTHYDPQGQILSTTEWQHGHRVGWGGGF